MERNRHYLTSFLACLTACCRISLLSATTDPSSVVEPDYATPIKNVTVALGREAKLSCVVDNLAEYKVGWMKSNTQTILSLQNKVVTHNTRISVSHDEPSTWNLHIRQIQEDDRGCYMCQINTANTKKSMGCIDVHVPPDIIDAESSSDVKVTEGGDVSLKCKANGYPEPNITWKRENGEKIILRKGRKEKTKVDEVKGMTLNLTRVNKRHMGAYHCIANNGVPPAVVKRIEVNVHFAPSIEVHEQLVGSPVGSDMVLRCLVEASPKPITFWQRKDTRDIIMANMKYNVTEKHHSYKVNMTLVVKRLTNTDYGAYLCNARNSLGMAEELIRTYRIKMEPHKPSVISRGSPSSTSRNAYNDIHKKAMRGRNQNSNTDRSSDLSSTSSGLKTTQIDNGHLSPSSEKDHSVYAEGHHRDLNFVHYPPSIDTDSSSCRICSSVILVCWHFMYLLRYFCISDVI